MAVCVCMGSSSNRSLVQDLYNLAQPRNGVPNVVCLLGPPGSGKTSLLLDAVAAAIPGSPVRLATATPGCLPGLAEALVCLMVHKALMRLSLGFPSNTIAFCMKAMNWVKVGNARPGYEAGAAHEIAQRRLHVLDEVQAMMPFLGQYLHRLCSAHGVLLDAGGDPKRVFRDCSHIFSMDPQQSPCREQGVASVTAAGEVVRKDASVKMPWTRLMEATGLPSAHVTYTWVMLHGQRRMSGLLFRLLADPCAPPSIAFYEHCITVSVSVAWQLGLSCECVCTCTCRLFTRIRLCD